MMYLGAPIENSPHNVNFWEPLVMKFSKKFRKWKNLSVSIAGRLLVLKSVLDNIPIYWLNLFKILSSVIKRIFKIRRDFIWQGLSQNSKKNASTQVGYALYG